MRSFRLVLRALTLACFIIVVLQSHCLVLRAGDSDLAPSALYSDAFGGMTECQILHIFGPPVSVHSLPSGSTYQSFHSKPGGPTLVFAFKSGTVRAVYVSQASTVKAGPDCDNDQSRLLIPSALCLALSAVTAALAMAARFFARSPIAI